METLTDRLQTGMEYVDSKNSALGLEQGFSVIFSDRFNTLPDKVKTCGYVLVAKAYYQLDICDRAFHYANLAIQTDRKDAFAYHLRGISQSSLGKIEEAVEDLTICISLNQEFPEVNKDLAICYFKLREYDLAIETIDLAIAKDPQSVHIQIAKGVMLSRTKSKLEAQKCFDRALQLDPSIETFESIAQLKSELKII
jgi:tetratricopeptide (TPR) repeat protein